MNEVNLIPSHRVVRRRRISRVRRWALGIGAYTGVLVIALLLQAPETARGEQAPLDARVAAAERQVARSVADLELATREHAELLQRIGSIRIINERPAWSVLLERLAEIHGENVMLSQIELTTNGARPGARDLGPVTRARLVLVGHATGQSDVSGYAARLEASGLFSRVSIVHTRPATLLGRAGVSFRVECGMGNGEGPGS